MFTNHIPMVSITEELDRELEAGYKCIALWLAVTIGGMIFVSVWQWAYNIHATSLMEAPFLFRAMMVGGLIAFIVSLINTLFVLPTWYDIRECFSRKRS